MLIRGYIKLLITSCIFALTSSCGNAGEQNGIEDLENASTSSALISIELAIDPSGFADHKVLLKSTLTNNSSDDIAFLPWGTPFESAVTSDFLVVTNVDTGESLNYQGIMAKRRPPKSEDYVTVISDQSIERILDISRSYNFCANNRYTIEFSGTLNDRESKALNAQSKGTEVELTGTFKAC